MDAVTVTDRLRVWCAPGLLQASWSKLLTCVCSSQLSFLSTGQRLFCQPVYMLPRVSKCPLVRAIDDSIIGCRTKAPCIWLRWWYVYMLHCRSTTEHSSVGNIWPILIFMTSLAHANQWPLLQLQSTADHTGSITATIETTAFTMSH